jgi:hypothetical protein
VETVKNIASAVIVIGGLSCFDILGFYERRYKGGNNRFNIRGKDALRDLTFEINRQTSTALKSPYPFAFSISRQKYIPITSDEFAQQALPMFPAFFRFLLAILFVGSFILRPIVVRPVNLIWRRIVESEKPVFTLTFGGAAAFASAISEAAKHL